MPKRKGEPLSEYIARLVDADEHRIRLAPDYIDQLGNVIVRPVVMFGRDASDDIRPVKIDSEGHTQSWPGGTTIEVTGQYLDATVGNTTGLINIEIVPGDEVIFMYGFARSFTKVTSGNLEFRVMNGSDTIGTYGRDAISANESNKYPGLGNTASQNNNYTNFFDPLVRMITPETGDYWRVSLTNMASGEKFSVWLRFRSKLGTALVVSASGGTFA